MKALKIFGVIMTPFIIMFVVAAIWKCTLNRYYYFERFPTYAAAGGLAPRFTPPSATDIRYIHGNESPDMWLSFDFDPREISEIRNRCDRVAEGEIELAPEPPGNFIDWPEVLTGGAPVKADDIPGYEFYRCKGPAEGVTPLRRILAVDVEKGKAYYWAGY